MIDYPDFEDRPRFAAIPDGDTTVDAAQTLTAACHHRAYNAGWWHNASTGQDIRNHAFYYPTKLMLTVSELAEAMEGDRSDRMDDKLPQYKQRDCELADVVIRCFDLAGGSHAPLAEIIAAKLTFNDSRPDHQITNRAATGGKKY